MAEESMGLQTYSINTKKRMERDSEQGPAVKSSYKNEDTRHTHAASQIQSISGR